MDGHESRFGRRSGWGRGGRHCSNGQGRDGAPEKDAWDGLRGGQNDWQSNGQSSWHDRGPRTLYRARDGKLMGVCKGLAQHFGMSVFMVRALFIAAALFTGFWPVVGLYVLAGLVMKPRPVLQPADAGERDFYGSYVSSRGEALRRLKDKFDRLEGRIRRMEDVVTRRDFDWDRRFGAQR
ncbi:MAG TPA: envelope stress response membrane protein PspC [Nitratidesulfovibrio sp.]|nr:envelope stress response membrane protein PspC [Nitratidesulfovibrio sp.]